MLVPDRLEDWTFDVVRDLAAEGRSETDRFDFKLGLQPPEHQTKLCCAMANSHGGFLVFGVGQRGSGWNFDGVQLDAEFAAKFGRGVRAEPTIAYLPPRIIALPDSDDRALYVVHVPRSDVRPHLPSRTEERFFWKRTNTGCERMTLEEVRAEFMGYEERREKLKLLALELSTNLRIMETYWQQPAREPFEVPSSAVLDRVLVDSYSLIQRDVELLRLLVEIQREVRKAQSRANLLFASMAGAAGLGERVSLLMQHNGSLPSTHAALRTQTGAALRILAERFGFKDPLAINS